MHLLYIDPGTGSALFSILIGAAATLFFLGRALIIKLKVVFSGGKTSASSLAANPYVIYNEGRQYCNVFKPVLDEFEARGISVNYLTSAEDDPLLKEPFNHIKGEFIGEGNRAFSRLNMLNADVVLMTTPGLDVYQLKRSKGVKHYAHILHAPSDATLYRLFGIDYFDSILLTGDHQANDIRILEEKRNLKAKKLVTVGCTYLDVFAEKIKQIPKEENHPFTVLVSPSWGPSAILSLFGEKLLDPLVKTGWRIIVRPHPQSKKSESAMLEKLAGRYRDAANLEWNYESENIYSLAKSDIMISDFSGIIYDYMFLFDRPVMYVSQGFDLRPYDADDLGENAIQELWHFKTVKEAGVELKEEHFDTIAQTIQKMTGSSMLSAARLEAKKTAWAYPGEAGKRVVDFMIDTVNIAHGKNIHEKQKAVFLDRDGTINVLIENDFVTKPEQFELIDGAAEAIKKINSLGYLVIVITNQPLIARGEIDLQTLDLIHMKMKTDLGKRGAYIDDLFFCPHHPDKGFAGERPEYKIDCDCRKPKPGMILKAAEKYNIDVSQSYMVGDNRRDVQAGINAGCIPVFLTGGREETKETVSDLDVQIFSSLKKFADTLAPK